MGLPPSAVTMGVPGADVGWGSAPRIMFDSPAVNDLLFATTELHNPPSKRGTGNRRTNSDNHGHDIATVRTTERDTFPNPTPSRDGGERGRTELGGPRCRGRYAYRRPGVLFACSRAQDDLISTASRGERLRLGVRSRGETGFQRSTGVLACTRGPQHRPCPNLLQHTGVAGVVSVRVGTHAPRALGTSSSGTDTATVIITIALVLIVVVVVVVTVSSHGSAGRGGGLGGRRWSGNRRGTKPATRHPLGRRPRTARASWQLQDGCVIVRGRRGVIRTGRCRLRG